MSDDVCAMFRRMAARETRHEYGIWYYWNAVEYAADEIDRLRAQLAERDAQLNAALIAAAPELAELLASYPQWSAIRTSTMCAWHEKRRALLARIEREGG